jgi:hypothetical protein
LIDRLIAIRRTGLWLEVEINSDILFDTGKPRSTPAHRPLDKLADVLVNVPNSIRVEGYTDDRPIAPCAFPPTGVVGRARAASVVHLFAAKGIAPDRLAMIGYGSTSRTEQRHRSRPQRQPPGGADHHGHAATAPCRDVEQISGTTPTDHREALRRDAHFLSTRSPARDGTMKTWAIANQKGGVGKTTTTLSIGRGLASRGLRVLMLDLDPHSSLTRAFGVPDEPAPRGVVDLFDPAPPALAELAMPTAIAGLDLIASQATLATLERRSATQPGLGMALSQTFAHQAGLRWDYVLLDPADARPADGQRAGRRRPSGGAHDRTAGHARVGRHAAHRANGGPLAQRRCGHRCCPR